jgi:hypothetical protein
MFSFCETTRIFVSNDFYNRRHRNTKYLETLRQLSSRLLAQFKQWHHYEKNITGSKRRCGALRIFHCRRGRKRQTAVPV